MGAAHRVNPTRAQPPSTHDRQNASYEAVHIEDGSTNIVRRVTALGYAKNVIQVRYGSGHEVADVSVGGGDKAGRCIWLLATSYALVHDNFIEHCYGHSLDVDAHVEHSAVFSNVMWNNGYQAIFVEENCERNFVFNNSIFNTTYTGIEVYALWEVCAKDVKGGKVVSCLPFSDLDTSSTHFEGACGQERDRCEHGRGQRQEGYQLGRI